MKIKPESLPEGDAIKIIAIAKEEFIIYEYFSYINNNQTIDIYNELISIIKTEFDQYSQFDERIKKLENKAKSELEGTDLEFIKICLSTAVYSMKLWTPVEMNGLGYAQKLEKDYLGSASNNLTNRGPCDVGNGVASDTAGAAGVFFSWGIGIAIPGANGAIAAGIAFGGAFASSMWAINNCIL